MLDNPFCIQEVLEGNNSVLIKTSRGNVLYEKLANTIHVGREELGDVQKRVESIKYNPSFELDSLKRKKNDPLEALVLNVTERCNLGCSYCIYSGKYENERCENSSEMDFETAKEAIDFFVPKSKDPMLVSFYGGEPLNNEGLIKQVIDYIHNKYPERKPVFSMTSNFYNANLFLKDLIEAEIYINISLDGPADIHDRNRKLKDGRGTYFKIIDNITQFRKISPEYAKTHFSYNVTCENPEDLPRIVKFFQENEQFTVSRISMTEIKGLKEAKTHDTNYVSDLMSEYMGLIVSESNPGILKKFFDQGLKNIAMRSNETMPNQLMLNGCCYPGTRKLFADTDGKLYMCEKFGRRASIGDVERGIQQDLVDLLLNEFLSIRNNHCTKGCWAQRLCNPCIQSAKDPNGQISKDGLAQDCKLNQSQILIALTNYAILSNENRKLFEMYITQLNELGR
jgi:uncharacterized protein